MRTKLFGKSNAVLSEVTGGEGNPAICIIVCGKDEEISAKVKEALRGHHVVDGDITIDNEDGVLTNQEPLKFSAEWEDEGESCIRDFELQILPTY
jgi:hypothetical protein